MSKILVLVMSIIKVRHTVFIMDRKTMFPRHLVSKLEVHFFMMMTMTMN